MQGRVRNFDGCKGYGFIMAENGQDVFVHCGDIVGIGRRKLSRGQVVSFEIVPTDRGLRAAKVTVIETPTCCGACGRRLPVEQMALVGNTYLCRRCQSMPVPKGSKLISRRALAGAGR